MKEIGGLLASNQVRLLTPSSLRQALVLIHIVLPAHIATAFVKKIDGLLASDQVCLLAPRGLKRAVEGCDSAVRPNQGRSDTADATGALLASPPTE